MTRGQLNAGMWKCLPFLTSHARASPSTPCRTGDDLVLRLHTSVQLLGLFCLSHCRAGDCESPLESCLTPQGERISKELPNTCLNASQGAVERAVLLFWLRTPCQEQHVSVQAAWSGSWAD